MVIALKGPLCLLLNKRENVHQKRATRNTDLQTGLLGLEVIVITEVAFQGKLAKQSISPGDAEYVHTRGFTQTKVRFFLPYLHPAAPE